MTLLTETNAQYYAGQQDFGTLTSGPGLPVTLAGWSFNTLPVSAFDSAGNQIDSVSNYVVYYDSGSGYNALDEDWSYVENTNQVVVRNFGSGYNGKFYVQLKQFAISNNYGSYEYITLGDIINNFIVGYVGAGKLIPGCKRTDIMFHAKRGLQEFSYDTLKCIKSQELTIPPSLSLPIPQDYINYVKCSWIDDVGAKHIIYPTRVTSNPRELPIQDDKGIPTQDSFGENIEAAQSFTDDRWADRTLNVDNMPDDYRVPKRDFLLGQRYGLQPEEAQVNGMFTINKRLGKFSFSSDLAGKLIILEYISDGLAVDEDMKLPKMAEQAMYMHISHAILSGRANVPEYIVNRFKRERSSALRNAKIRLSNIKTEEIAQVFRNKAKWIKH